MERFVAPQFIDVEDKIIGPITTRQFIMMIIGGIIIFLAFKIFDVMAFILVALLVAGAVILFGFVKINGRRFNEYVASMIETLRRPRVRVWFKQATINDVLKNQREESGGEKVKTELTAGRKRINPASLKELALLVDTGGRYRPEE
jgi:hypothetical protein